MAQRSRRASGFAFRRGAAGGGAASGVEGCARAVRPCAPDSGRCAAPSYRQIKQVGRLSKDCKRAASTGQAIHQQSLASSPKRQREAGQQ